MVVAEREVFMKAKHRKAFKKVFKEIHMSLDEVEHSAEQLKGIAHAMHKEALSRIKLPPATNIPISSEAPA